MRSKWKGPFINEGLLERVRRFVMSGEQQKAAFKVTSRASTIVPEMMGLRFAVHNGHKFTPIEIRDHHLGHKVSLSNPIIIYLTQ